MTADEPHSNEDPQGQKVPKFSYNVFGVGLKISAEQKKIS